MSWNTCKCLAAVILIAGGFAPARAQESAARSDDEQSIRKSAESYCEAFNRGDVAALLTFWADDADYVDADGEACRGKEAIGAMFDGAKEDLNGQKLTLKIDSLRLVKPEVAVEDGTATLTSPDGEATSGRYTAVLVKDGDTWLISSAHDLPSDPDAAEAPESEEDHLQPLEWLVGDWVSEGKGAPVKLTANWALDKSFLALDYSMARDSGEDTRVMQWIGFDPLTGQFKSWTFDSRGGYGDGVWTQADNGWQIDTTGVLPDGRTGAAHGSVSLIDDTHCKWSSTQRNVEGQPMPDVEVRFVRSEAKENAESR
jgi:uncharacterized protein (TIGR02246 family)